MSKKFLSIAPLVFLQIIVVCNLQLLPINATYGLLLPALYGVAALLFFIPCVLMVAELATNYPQNGGAYLWGEKAFGPRMGFFLVGILWIANLLWYPSLLMVIAANFAYLWDPLWANSKFFLLGFGVLLFWAFTLFNCFGIQLSTRFSIVCSIIGIILPIMVLIVGGVAMGGFSPEAFASLEEGWHFRDFENPQYLLAIIASLFGMEISAVHAGDVIHPKRDYPRSLFISAACILSLLLFSELMIAFLIPVENLSILTGLYDAFTLFFEKSALTGLLLPILFLIFMGNVGGLAAWMMGSTRGMFIASQQHARLSLLQKTNRFNAPVGVLLFEGVIFTLASGIIILFPNVINSLWLLLALAVQISLLYYALLFICTIRLRSKMSEPQGFIIPGGKIVLWLLMGVGALVCLAGFVLGFMPPEELDAENIWLFQGVMTIGLFCALGLPLIFFKAKPRSLN